MILVDTSVWVEHLRRGVDRLAALLRDGRVLCHPFVIGELACGPLRKRAEILGLLATLPRTPVLEQREALHFVDAHGLVGVGWIDVHLLGSAVVGRVRLWTGDRALARAAARLRVAA